MRSAKRLASTIVKEAAFREKTLSELASTLRGARSSISKLVRGSDKASKIEAIGVGLLLLPDPAVVTYVAGALLLGAGRVYKRLARSTSLESTVSRARSLIRELEALAVV